MLGVRGRLLSASGASLHGDLTVQQAELRSGDWLTLHTRPLLLSATSAAVAAVLSDGSVVTWGESDMGGDSGVVPLDDVRHIEATQSAFAVIRDDGSVVTWGRPRWGGDSSAVVERLKLGSCEGISFQLPYNRDLWLVLRFPYLQLNPLTPKPP